MAIIPHIHQDLIATDWSISLSGGLIPQLNPCKYNLQRLSRQCQIRGCSGTFRANRTSGLCDEHLKHTNDLVLAVIRLDVEINFPSHIEIIELLIDWAHSRNYRLEPFFEGLGFNILGNIPDVTTLDGVTPLSPIVNTSLPELFNDHVVKVVDQFFPTSNNASYQLLVTRSGVSFPARILAIIFASLVFCEEANRGDRWFYRTIVKDETKTKILGGAMPIAYFAARRFNWGVEMKGVLGTIFR